MDSFYVYLQSDASDQHYSDNVRTNFRNHLAIPIELDSSRYEVALTELSYTYNDPYIRKGTQLYKVYSMDRPRTREVPYSTRNVRSDTSLIKTVDIEVLEYAKTRHKHISIAEEEVTALDLPRVKGTVRLYHGSLNVLATNKITSTIQLIEVLNEKLRPLEMVYELYEDPDDGTCVRLIERKPEIIFKREIDYADIVVGHIQLGNTASFKTQNGQFIIDGDVATEPISIEPGTRLLTIEFIKGESYVAPGVQNTVLVDAKATIDIFTLQQLAEQLSKDYVIGLEVTVQNNRARIKIHMPGPFRLVVNERVQSILGVTINPQNPPATTIIIDGKDNTVFDLGLKKIYVYTDIVNNQRIGDQVAPLLRITDYTGDSNQIIIKDFNQLHYIRLDKDYIDSIRIYLKTEIGEDLPLTFGTVSCTLHFREKRF